MHKHKILWLLTRRRWWRDPDTLILIVCIVGLAAIILWPRKSESGYEPCLIVWRQGFMTTEARGVLNKTAAGIPVCETGR